MAKYSSAEEALKQIEGALHLDRKDPDAVEYLRQCLAGADDEPVFTIVAPDPFDERDGPFGINASHVDWERLAALPSGTKLYTRPAPDTDAPTEEQTDSTEGQRAAFEAEFPPPAGAEWCGGIYRPTNPVHGGDCLIWNALFTGWQAGQAEIIRILGVIHG